MKSYSNLIVLLSLNLLPFVEAFNTAFRPTKQQIQQGRKRATITHKPAPLQPPLLPPGYENLLQQLPELPDMEDLNPLTPSTWNSMTSAVLGLATKLAPKQQVQASDRAARIQLNRFPPQSFQIDLTDVPLVGKALSGTYAKVKEVKQEPSIVISSPKDKLGAVQQAASDGNLEFGLQGLLSTTLDVQLEPNRPGVALIQVKSPLIPKWPFGKDTKSDWNKVTNLGNGEMYYFNAKTGQVQYEEPND